MMGSENREHWTIRMRVSQLNADLGYIQRYKKEHPDERLGYYPWSVGSVLNAYREGDLTFDEAAALLEPRTAQVPTTNSPAPPAPDFTQEWLIAHPEYSHAPATRNSAPWMPAPAPRVCPVCGHDNFNPLLKECVEMVETPELTRVCGHKCSFPPVSVGEVAGWLPIESCLKVDGDEYLLGHANSVWLDTWIVDPANSVRDGEDGYWMMCDQWEDTEIPTHWQPAPKPPLPAPPGNRSDDNDHCSQCGGKVENAVCENCGCTLGAACPFECDGSNCPPGVHDHKTEYLSLIEERERMISDVND